MKYFFITIIVLVSAAIVGSFFITTTPWDARALKIDERRANDLSYVQSEVMHYWGNEGVLPPSLADLENKRVVKLPKDPTTNADYTYQKKADDKFSLCATFERSSPAVDSRLQPVSFERWDHGVGYFCFERTLDNELKNQYKENNNIYGPTSPINAD